MKLSAKMVGLKKAVATLGMVGCIAASVQAQVPSGSQMVDRQAILKFVNDSSIVAQADGLITGIAVDEGGTIGAGQTLIELDTRLAAAELRVAQKEHEAATEKASNRSNIEYNELSYKLAKKITENHRILLQKGATSQGEYDKVVLEEDKARLQGVLAEVEQRTNQLAAEVNEAKVGAANVQVELRQIKAPFDGLVAERVKQPNDYVRVGEKIVRLVGMEKLHVIGRIPARDVDGPLHLLENANATAIVMLSPAIGNVPAREVKIPGKLSFVSPVQGEDGTIRVKMEIDNVKDRGSWVLRDGMVATLIVQGAR
ncbi:MAG: HlyD family efflux transporter periplasmic adaptor subunit [Pirellulales bacterium]